MPHGNRYKTRKARRSGYRSVERTSGQSFRSTHRAFAQGQTKDILQHTVSSAGAARGYPHSKHAAAGVPVHHLPLPERRRRVAPAPPAGAPCPPRPTTKQAATQHWAGPAAHVYAAGASRTGQVDVLPRAAPATAEGQQPNPSTATISVTQCSLLVAVE